MNERQEPRLEWEHPKVSVDELIESYVSLAGRVPGVLKIWALVEGNVLYFTTLIEDDREVERAVYEAELKLIDTFGSEHVSFDVHRDGSATYEASGESRLVLATV